MIKISRKHLIHTVLGHSYIMFMMFFCIAILCDQIYPIDIASTTVQNSGIIFVFLGTLLVTWAQTNSKKSLHERHAEIGSYQAFRHGPYRFLRTPTQVGLFLLLLGLGLVINIFWVPVFSIIALIINLLFFVKQQESILTRRYGQSYKLYKTKVRF